jgi:hypothetical protein
MDLLGAHFERQQGSTSIVGDVDAPLVRIPSRSVFDEVRKGEEGLPPRVFEAREFRANVISIRLPVSDMEKIARHAFSPG